MNLRVFLAALIVYQQNFKLLHWCAKGHNFNMIHEQAKNYYEKMDKDIDDVAEICLICNLRPLNIKEAYSILEESDGEYLQLDSSQDYDIDAFIQYTDVMLKSILSMIEELTDSDEIDDDSLMGVESYLENLHYEYLKEYKYINARRK